MPRKFKNEALRLDPSLKASLEPYVWPQTPPGRTGKRWFIRNREGEVVGEGKLGNAKSAWENAFYMLRAKADGRDLEKELEWPPRGSEAGQ